MKQSKERAISPYRLAPPHATSIPHELIPLLPANWPTEIPLARITTCGTTVSIAVLQRIDPTPDASPSLVYGPPDAALLAEKGTSTALTLLGVLASQSGCSATTDWLSETLGHLHHGEDDEDDDDVDERPGLKRVDNVVTQLRHLLFPPMLRELPTAPQVRRRLVIAYRASRESGPGYRLAGLPLLWVDVEAIGEHLKRARALDQFGQDGLNEWQAAYELAGQGVFVAQEPYSDWASWRRQQVESQLWDSVQTLWRRLANQGEMGEREAARILQHYWQSHITSEDALRPLIELLGKQECYGQAEEYYAHVCLALEQEGKQPDRRTQEAMTFLRALQIQRKQVAPISPSSVIRRLVNTVDSTASTALFPYSNILHDTELHERLRYALRKPSAVDEATLEHLESITNDCWRMIPAVTGLVSYHSRGYVLERLEGVIRLLEGSQPNNVHERLCSIASTLSLIVANISSNMGDYTTAKIYYELSIEAAQEARNAPLQAVGLVRLSFDFTRSDRPDMALPLTQEALRLITQSGNKATTTSAWIAAALAEVYANLKDSEACFDALGQAELQSDFVPEEDPYSTTFSSPLLAGYKGICYTLLRLPEDAENVLHDALKQLSATASYQRGYILSDLALSCLQQGKGEETYQHASNALALAVQTKSPEIFHRVRKVRDRADSWASTIYGKNLDRQLDDLERLFSAKRG